MISIPALEFSYTQAPKKMKSFISSLNLLSVSLGASHCHRQYVHPESGRHQQTPGTGLLLVLCHHALGHRHPLLHYDPVLSRQDLSARRGSVRFELSWQSMERCRTSTVKIEKNQDRYEPFLIRRSPRHSLFPRASRNFVGSPSVGWSSRSWYSCGRKLSPGVGLMPSPGAPA